LIRRWGQQADDCELKRRAGVREGCVDGWAEAFAEINGCGADGELQGRCWEGAVEFLTERKKLGGSEVMGCEGGGFIAGLDRGKVN
jgi:hypothetical protein